METCETRECAPARADRVAPRVDIYEGPSGVLLLADLPGTTPEGLEVTFQDGTLVVRGEVAAAEPGDMKPLHRELALGSERFERTFRLAPTLDPESIRASLANGTLRVEVGRRESKRTIAVSVG